jgi:two-component system, LytTR family, sensor kinase
MNNFWKYKVDHIGFWIATVGFHMFTRVDMISRAGPAQFALEIIVRNALLAVLIYVNLVVLIPKLAQQKKILLYIASLVLTLGLYVLLKNVHDVYLHGYVLGDQSRTAFFYNSYYNFSIAIFYLSFSVALQLSKAWYFQRELIRKMEIEKLSSELDYLRAQINPHFVFNSINTVYFQIDKQNVDARDSLSAFSDLLRYQLYECNGNEIPIEKEIVYLQNYIELQRKRKDENYNISFLAGDNLNGFTISPLLLIPFVENAFKHVSHYSCGNQVRIMARRRNDSFELSVFNTKERKATLNGHDGIGLKNAKRRLELLYKNRHKLIIDDEGDSYEVNLSLKIS